MDNNEGNGRLRSSVYAGPFPGASSSPLRRKYGTHNCTTAGTIKIDLPYRLARLLSGRKLRLKDRYGRPAQAMSRILSFWEDLRSGDSTGGAGGARATIRQKDSNRQDTPGFTNFPCGVPRKSFAGLCLS